MERISRLIAKLPAGANALEAEGLVRAAWPAAVGRKVAARTRAARMVRTRLIVEVEDALWQRQLFALSGQILANLERRLGRGVVEDLEFRVIPRRREFQRADVAQPALAPPDEADQIADPVLRSVYKHSRKKALA